MKRVLKITLTACLCTLLFALLALAGSAETSTKSDSGYDYSYDYYTVTVTYEDSYEFTGKEITPEYSVRLTTSDNSERTLVKGEDFTETLNSGIYPSGSSYSVYLSGIGEYSFDLTVYYSVYYDKTKVSVKIPSVSYSYYMPSITPKVTYNGTVVIPSSEYDWSFDEYNYKIGTYPVTVSLENPDDCITLKSSVKITALDVSECTVASISTQSYTGYEVTPDMYVTFKTAGGTTMCLYEGSDYTVKYSNNKNIGTATAKLTFKGNCKGTKTVTFKIDVGQPAGVYVSNSNKTNSVSIWSYSAYTYMYVYRYNSKTAKYEYIGKSKSSYYNDTITGQLTTYKYAVKCVVVSGDKKYSSGLVYASVKTGLFSPTVKLTTKKGSVKVAWTKNTKATGYEVYRYDTSSGNTKKLTTVKKNTTLSYTDKTCKDSYNYLYYVIATKGSVKSSQDSYVSSLDPASILRGVKLTSKKSFNVYNTQGKTRTKAWTSTLSTKDINTLKAFAKKHFKSGWTAAQKVEYTLNWIHSNVTYASSTVNWNKISGKTYVDAIFNYKLGQCLQYNGALAAMMTYLGFDVKLIQGYRCSSSGSKWQHFWCECTANGLTYVMETGNKKDGSWCYFFKPYRYTGGYMLNGKYASGDMYTYY